MGFSSFLGYFQGIGESNESGLFKIRSRNSSLGIDQQGGGKTIYGSAKSELRERSS
jgi:hypothetical protein